MPRHALAKDLLLAHGALALAFVPWLVFLPGQLEKVTRAFWITRPGPAELVRTSIMYHFHLPLPDPWLLPAGFLALLLVAITAMEVRRMWRTNAAARDGLLPLIVLALTPPVLMFLVSQLRPVYIERAIMIAAGAYYLLLAAALRALPIRPLAWALAAVLVLGVGAANAYQYAYESFPRSPFDRASSYLKTAVRPDDLVVHDNKLSYFPLYYLAPELPQAFLADPPGSPNDTLAAGTQDALGLHPIALPEGVRGRRRIWLVVFQKALSETDTGGLTPSTHAWFDLRYRGRLEERIGDLNIYLYHMDPFDQAQDRPFDQAQDRPFDQAQGRPFDQALATASRPIRQAQGMLRRQDGPS